jgi:hypothetical protein
VVSGDMIVSMDGLSSLTEVEAGEKFLPLRHSISREVMSNTTSRIIIIFNKIKVTTRKTIVSGWDDIKRAKLSR